MANAGTAVFVYGGGAGDGGFVPLEVVRELVQSGEVVGQGRQRELDSNLGQSPCPELPHFALLFQHSENRFHHCLASRVNFASRRLRSLRRICRSCALRTGAARRPPFNSHAKFESGT